jgi:hypothetical protein
MEIDRFEKKIPGQLFQLGAQMYCGFFVPTHVMKKLMRIDAEHAAKVRDVLTEHINDIHLENWTGHFPADANGVCTGSEIVHFVDSDAYSDKEFRISLFKPKQPMPVDVYRCTREEAQQIAEGIWNEKHSEKHNEQDP